MKYHDTGGQDPDHTLAKWFEEALRGGMRELRLQSGYFRGKALRAIDAALATAAESNLLTRILIGSNERETLHSDVRRLVARLQLPRPAAQLGIVTFSNALFHPKSYHITRSDGSQTAFIGSANFTEPGVTGKNVEAAVSLDTAHGDPAAVLAEIAAAIDGWFSTPSREGFHLVNSAGDADKLQTDGILASVRPPRKPAGFPGDSTASGAAPAKRKVLISLPALPDEDEELDEEAVAGTVEDTDDTRDEAAEEPTEEDNS